LRRGVRRRQGRRRWKRGGEVEVDEHDVARVLDEDVLRLEVAVRDAEAVEVLQDEHQLRSVEPDDGLRERRLGAPPAPERLEVAAGAAVDGEADDVIGGHDAAEGGKQRVPEREQHVALEPDPPVPVTAARASWPRGSAGHGLERHGHGVGARTSGAVPGCRRRGDRHDVEDHAPGALAEHGQRPEVRQAQLLRRRGRHAHHGVDVARKQS